jgi:hypothetical protein
MEGMKDSAVKSAIDIGAAFVPYSTSWRRSVTSSDGTSLLTR